MWLTWWVVCAAFWLALDDTTAFTELVDGAVAAALGATGATLVYRERLVRVRVRVTWALDAWRAGARVGPDLGVLAAVLWRVLCRRERPAGALRSVPFDPPGDDAEQTGRRVLATIAGSLAPNTIVLDIDEETDQMLVHQLVATTGARSAADPMRLG